jgi:hypothetical protein
MNQAEPRRRSCSGRRLACRRAGHLARRKVRRNHFGLERDSGGRDAPLYGRRDARRYGCRVKARLFLLDRGAENTRGNCGH